MGKSRKRLPSGGRNGRRFAPASWTIRVRALAALTGLLVAVLPAVPAHAQEALPDLSHPLTLDELVNIAVQRNLDLAQAGQNVETARGVYTGSFAGLLPNASAEYGFSRSAVNSTLGQAYYDPTQQRVVQTGGGTTYSSSWGTSVSGSTNLISLPAWYDYRQAKSGLTAARFGLTDSRTGIILAVRQEYFSVIGAKELAKVNEEAYTLAQDQLKRSQSLFQLGSVAKSDVLQADVNLASAERDRISAVNTIEQERAKLAVLLALPLDAPLAVADPDSLPDSLSVPAEAAAVVAAQQHRPDLREAEVNLEAARQGEQASKTRRYPSLGGTYSYSKHRDGAGDVLNAFSDDYQADFSLGLSLTLFDGLATKGRIEQSVAQRHQAEELLSAKQLQVGLEVREAVLQIKNAAQEIRSTRQGVSFAVESVRLQKALYESGGGTLLEWNNALVQLTRARQALVQGEIDYRLAEAALSKATGEDAR